MEASTAVTAAALPGDGGSAAAAQMSGMSRAQLYEVMSQMKSLMEQNEDQARKILIDNPFLTRALFQAQIMLGMVRPSKMVPEIQQAFTQAQSSQVEQTTKVHSVPHSSLQAISQDQSRVPPSAASLRETDLPRAPSFPLPITQQQSVPTNNPQFLQIKQQSAPHLNQVALSQSSQVSNVTLPPPPPPVVPQYSNHPPHIPVVSGPAQQPLQTPMVFNQQLQPPLPQLPRPSSMQQFAHQIQQQIPASFRLDHGVGSQQPYNLPLYHTGGSFQNSFPAAQLPLPSQRPLQQPYQGTAHASMDFNSRSGLGMQAERSGLYMGGRSDLSSIAAAQNFGQIPLVHGQINQGIGVTQQLRPPPLTPDMEKALLQQVMSLTPEQINSLPPEQRQQVLQLREMLRP